MAAARTVVLLVILFLAGCATPAAGPSGSSTSSPPATPTSAEPMPSTPPPGGSSQSPTPVSGTSAVQVTGTVLASPGCPGPQRAESPCPPKPVPGAPVELAASGTVIARTTTDSGGRFAFSVKPGRYTVTAHNVGYASSQSQDIVVSAAMNVKLVVDSGLR